MTDVRAVIDFDGADGNRLAGEVFGSDGPPVLFLHGGGQTRYAWTKTAEAVAGGGFRSVVVDQRGHGDSAWAADRAYRFSDFGRDARALARSVEARTGCQPVLVGASLGGIAGLLAQAEAGGALLAGLVLVDVTPSLNLEGLRKIQRFMGAKVVEGFATVEDAADAVSLYLPGRARPPSLEGLSRNLRRHADGRLRWHWDPALLDARSGIMSGGDDAGEALRSAARSLAIPTLLVRGGSSDLVTETEVAEFRSLAPAADCIDIADAGHMVAGDRNDVFSGAVLNFLSRSGPATWNPDAESREGSTDGTAGRISRRAGFCWTALPTI